jgi:uncharacterized repeat protein (TIGR03803 family)
VTTLASFTQASGFSPSSPLIQGTDGNFYGTTPVGGANYPGFGTVFKVTPTSTLTVLHGFDGTDGEKSFAALVQGTDGNFYGTTSFGGANANFGGTVFKITPSGTLTTLHSFGSGDGSGASAALIQATDGNFYGTTSGFGVSNTGTAFKITSSGTLTTLHTLDGTDGILAYSTLLEGIDGDLYGTTEFGAALPAVKDVARSSAWRLGWLRRSKACPRHGGSGCHISANTLTGPRPRSALTRGDCGWWSQVPKLRPPHPHAPPQAKSR